MTVTVEETPSPADAINDAILKFTGCISNALSDICSVGWTLGDVYFPFNPDVDEDDDEEPCDVGCSQAWVRVVGITPKPSESALGFDGNECALTLSMTLEVGALRCLETPANGEAPTATKVMVAAAQSMTDMQVILNAALNCEAWDAIETGQWIPLGPLGSQFGGTWTFTVDIDAGTNCDSDE